MDGFVEERYIYIDLACGKGEMVEERCFCTLAQEGNAICNEFQHGLGGRGKDNGICMHAGFLMLHMYKQPPIPSRTPVSITILVRLALHNLLQPLHLLLQRPNLQHRHISLDIRLRILNLLRPPFTLHVHFAAHLLPLLHHVLVALADPPVPLDQMRLLRLQPGGHQQQRRIDDAHDVVVETLVAGGGHPPFKRDDEEEDLDDVEGGDEDVFIRGADELHRLLGEEGHVFVNSVVGDVGVGAVVEGDEDVEEDCDVLVVDMADCAGKRVVGGGHLDGTNRP